MIQSTSSEEKLYFAIPKKKQQFIQKKEAIYPSNYYKNVLETIFNRALEPISKTLLRYMLSKEKLSNFNINREGCIKQYREHTKNKITNLDYTSYDYQLVQKKI